MGKAKKISIIASAFISFLLASFFNYAAIKENPQMEFSSDYIYYLSLGHWNFLAFYITCLFIILVIFFALSQFKKSDPFSGKDAKFILTSFCSANLALFFYSTVVWFMAQ